jgi:hypothetical protein
MAISITTYPVEITADDLLTVTGIDLVKEYGQAGVHMFLREVHNAVYESGVYATGDKDIKNRIINAYLEKTKNSIENALVLQASYMHDVGNVGTESGITITADGQKAVVNKTELRSKILCPAAVDALKSCSCPLMYAGDEI